MPNTIVREQARPHMHNVFMLSFDDELIAYLLLTGIMKHGYTSMHTYTVGFSLVVFQSSCGQS